MDSTRQRLPTHEDQSAKNLPEGQEPQSCPRVRLPGEFFDKICPSTSDKQGKDIMNIKSKVKKYVHKAKKLSRAHEFA